MKNEIKRKCINQSHWVWLKGVTGGGKGGPALGALCFLLGQVQEVSREMGDGGKSEWIGEIASVLRPFNWRRSFFLSLPPLLSPRSHLAEQLSFVLPVGVNKLSWVLGIVL